MGLSSVALGVTGALAANADKINLAGSWATFWSKLNQGTFGQVMVYVGWIGLGVLLASVIKFAWDKRRGSGGQTSALLWSAIVGAICAAPNFLFPLVLKLADLLLNAGANLLK